MDIYTILIGITIVIGLFGLGVLLRHWGM